MEKRERIPKLYVALQCVKDAMELPRSLVWLVVGVLVWATVALAWTACFRRYTTNTAGGRFYRTDHWRGKTTVVEKDGSRHDF